LPSLAGGPVLAHHRVYNVGEFVRIDARIFHCCSYLTTSLLSSELIPHNDD
jgi:hypothetical protein